MTQSIQEEALKRFPPSMLIETPGGDDCYRDDEYGYDECQRKAFIAGAEWARSALVAERNALQAQLDKVRAARAGHPKCDVHTGGDAVGCGWKRAVADIDAALEVTD